MAAHDDFAFALTLPGHAHDTEMLVELLRTVLGHAGYTGDTLERLVRQVGSVRTAALAAAAVQRAVRGARRRTADRRLAGRARLAHHVPGAGTLALAL